jgi:hypothetical protein
MNRGIRRPVKLEVGSKPSTKQAQSKANVNFIPIFCEMLAAVRSPCRRAASAATKCRKFATAADVSGLKVVAVDNRQPSASVTVLVKAGPRYESKAGLAHALKNYAFKVRLRVH